MRLSYGKKYYEVSTNINAKDFLSTFHSEITVSSKMKFEEFEYSFLDMINLLNTTSKSDYIIDYEFCIQTARNVFKNLDKNEILVEEIDLLFEVLFPQTFSLCISANNYIVQLQYKRFVPNNMMIIPFLMKKPFEERAKTVKGGIKLGKIKEDMGIIIELKNKNFEIIRCITGNQDQGEQKVIIGTGQESNIMVDDPSWESIQFEIFSKEEKYYLRAYKCQFLTLFKIPMNKNIIVTTRDFLLLANSEGFVISRSCGINNLTDNLKKIIQESDSDIIHPKINELPEVMGNSTDPKLVIRFVKEEYIGRVFSTDNQFFSK